MPTTSRASNEQANSWGCQQAEVFNSEPAAAPKIADLVRRDRAAYAARHAPTRAAAQAQAEQDKQQARLEQQQQALSAGGNVSRGGVAFPLDASFTPPWKAPKCPAAAPKVADLVQREEVQYLGQDTCKHVPRPKSPARAPLRLNQAGEGELDVVAPRPPVEANAPTSCKGRWQEQCSSHADGDFDVSGGSNTTASNSLPAAQRTSTISSNTSNGSANSTRACSPSLLSYTSLLRPLTKGRSPGGAGGSGSNTTTSICTSPPPGSAVSLSAMLQLYSAAVTGEVHSCPGFQRCCWVRSSHN
uniref:Uncharacterized protein n=1 Tax=Dunaliella tertiolecta TaxID=3047 RepID=A0A6S8L528_DUNTE|mmetsp:Transcript_21324/g.59136  ORF Transcript_21324/g.59136 Transcript_21324/m.59136 type:complete len:301 (-) Transcript_21324:945-1847(-)